MFGIFRPAPQAPLPDAEVDSTYRRCASAGIFIGYAGLPAAQELLPGHALPHRGRLQSRPAGRRDVGHRHRLRPVEIHHGPGLGPFQPTGLPAVRPVGVGGGDVHFGFARWATSSVAIMFVLLFINGWARGGLAAERRTMVTGGRRRSAAAWWSGTSPAMSAAALIGPLFLLGLALFGDWRSAFTCRPSSPWA